MGISQYNVALFLHIGVVITSFMIAGVLHASLHALPRVKSVHQMRPFAGLVHRLEPLLPILAIFILGFGAWLIGASHHAWHWGDGWILTALITLIVIEGLAGSLLAPRTKALVAAIDAAPDGDVPAELRRQALDPVIWDIAHVATFGFLGVVFVMTNKPSGGVATLIVVIGAIVGVALSRLQLAAAAKQS
ncbi:MAG TPA: hypothetical protein VG899_08955 [Mycobacteriales bacterium]|nr:hypothetical protein [Mycobacteriales bacterium]